MDFVQIRNNAFPRNVYRRGFAGLGFLGSLNGFLNVAPIQKVLRYRAVIVAINDKASPFTRIQAVAGLQIDFYKHGVSFNVGRDR